MGFLDTLRGSGNKDGMRQTTSLTMAYLLEQNARFEAFMRQRVEELETIVTQQEARASTSAQEKALPTKGEETWSQEDGWPEAEEADDFGADVTASTFAFPSAAQDETRPVPAMPGVGQFVLDDVVGFEELAGRAPAGGVSSQAEEATPAASLEPDTGGLEVEADEPAEPPDWQAMFMGNPEEEAETGPVEPEATSAVEAGDPEGVQLDEAAEGSNGSDFVPDWLRRRQQELLSETESGSETPQSPASEEASRSGQQGVQKEQRTDHPVSSSSLAEKVKAAREEQAVLPAEVVGDDEAWDTSLEQTGPVEEWA
jgi:hypothetical protein